MISSCLFAIAHHLPPSSSISSPPFIALTGRPGSGVFPHQQYPRRSRPKGETTGKTISSRSVYTTFRLSAHAAQSTVSPTERLLVKSAETATSGMLLISQSFSSLFYRSSACSKNLSQAPAAELLPQPPDIPEAGT